MTQVAVLNNWRNTEDQVTNVGEQYRRMLSFLTTVGRCTLTKQNTIDVINVRRIEEVRRRRRLARLLMSSAAAAAILDQRRRRGSAAYSCDRNNNADE